LTLICLISAYSTRGGSQSLVQTWRRGISLGGGMSRTTVRNMCTPSGGAPDVEEKAKEAARRSEMLRKTLASLKSAPSTQGVRGGDVKNALGTTNGGGAGSVTGGKAPTTVLKSDEPRHWTTRPEPKVKAPPAKPTMTWGEWIKDKEAIKASLKHEYEHYRDGSKLLYYNVVATVQILRRKLRGQSLTRREYNMLVRTASDLFRLVPFAVIVIVPFMEFTLPILLKLFPNMLPSTFASKLQQKEQLKKQLNLKIEMARFLQDTLVEMKGDVSLDKGTIAFVEKLKSGEGMTTEDLVQFAKVFNEDTTLSGLQRNQLTAMCRMLGIQPFGTDSFLIVQIRMKIGSLKKDDRAIMAEGVDTLTLEELQHAVLARGMYSQTKNKGVLRERLKSWLDMSVSKNVPITLLILSRAFALNARADLAHTLKDTFAHMPQELIDEIEARVGGGIGRKVDRKLKLEALEQFRSLIAEERAAFHSGASTDPSSTPFAALATMTQPTELERLQIEELRAQVAHIKADLIDDVKALQQSLEALTEKLKKEQDADYAQLLEKRTAASSDPSITDIETDAQFNERWTNKRNSILAVELERQKEREAETKSARQLESRVVDLLAQLGVDVAEAKKELEDELKVLDKNYDGLISEDELKFALNTLDSKLSDEQIQVVLDRLDANHDGLIEVDHLFKVARELDIDLTTAVQEARAREDLINAKTAEATSTSPSSSAPPSSSGSISL
jgi:LETM1 and EF-hand domain-containing protein 1